jgi:hypothetical protein
MEAGEMLIQDAARELRRRIKFEQNQLLEALRCGNLRSYVKFPTKYSRYELDANFWLDFNDYEFRVYYKRDSGKYGRNIRFSIDPFAVTIDFLAKADEADLGFRELEKLLKDGTNLQTFSEDNILKINNKSESLRGKMHLRVILNEISKEKMQVFVSREELERFVAQIEFDDNPIGYKRKITARDKFWLEVLRFYKCEYNGEQQTKLFKHMYEWGMRNGFAKSESLIQNLITNANKIIRGK